MLDVRRLRLLRELAHRGTIAAVAQALAFTPSAVSQQLSALEREAGVPLLRRTGRRVTLTPAAAVLVDHAEAVLERLEHAAADLVDTRRGVSGTVRIGAFPTATRTVGLAGLAILRRDHPGLEPMLAEIDPADVAHALRGGTLDVALIHDYDGVPSLPERGLAVTRTLLRETMYLATADRDARTIGGNAEASWITATPGTLCRSMVEHACHAAGFAPRIRHQVDDFATVLGLVAAGQGVALVPELAVEEPPAGVVLIPLPIHRRTALAFRSGAATHPAVVAVRDAIAAALAYRRLGGSAELRSPR